MCREAPSEPIGAKFGMGAQFPNIIIYSRLYPYQLRDFDFVGILKIGQRLSKLLRTIVSQFSLAQGVVHKNKGFSGKVNKFLNIGQLLANLLKSNCVPDFFGPRRSG